MGLEDVTETGVSPWGDGNPSEKAKKLATSLYEVLNDGEVTAIDEYHSETLDYYRSSNELGSRQDLKDDVRMFLRAFPDLEATILDVFADDEDENLVTLRYEIEGTHAGTFETIPPTDQHVRAKGIGIARFDDEEVVEFSLVFDNLGMLEDLGLIK
ncbi:MAG: ester cyclase [Haloarculaceae archaeon]